ncbi:MAG: hypothetical protein WBK76_00945 [Candidatus Saccharimonadales bacterium]
MSLLDDCKALEPGYNGITNWSVLDEIDCEQVSNEHTGEGRWETYHTAVFRRDGEYVALDYSKPATEMQEGQDQSVAEFYSVEPYEVTVTKYRKI